MPGTVAGAAKAKAKILARDPDHFRKMGKLGGLKSRGGGFATKTPCFCDDIPNDHHKAQCAGLRGGTARGYKQRKSEEVTHA